MCVWMHACMYVCSCLHSRSGVAPARSSRVPNMASTSHDAKNKTQSPPRAWPLCQSSGRKTDAKPELKAGQCTTLRQRSWDGKAIEAEGSLSITSQHLCHPHLRLLLPPAHQPTYYNRDISDIKPTASKPSMLEPGFARRAAHRL